MSTGFSRQEYSSGLLCPSPGDLPDPGIKPESLMYPALACGFFTAQFSSVQSVVSDSLWPHGLQHTKLPCPSPTPGAYSNSSPLHWWCHPTISSSVVPFSSRLQSFPASGSFQMSRFFTSGGQSIWASASVPSMNSQELTSFRIDCFDLLAVQGTLKSLLQHHSSKASILQLSAFFIVFTASTTYIYSNKEPMWEALCTYIYINTHTHVHASVQLLSFLYSPTLTSIHDYWKNHSLD